MAMMSDDIGEIVGRYPLQIVNENLLDWLRANGKEVARFPHDLPHKPGKVYIRFKSHIIGRNTRNTFEAYVMLGAVHRDNNTSIPKWYSWLWFILPISVVFPFTDAPLL
jgi:hypothetical protein